MPAKSAGERELQAINSKLEELIQTVVQQFIGLKRGIEAADTQVLKAIVAGDAKVDAIELDLDDFAMLFVANRAPMGGSLRFMFGAIDIAAALERIGDCLEYVARHILESIELKSDFPEAWQLFNEMIAKAFIVFDRAVSCISSRDVILANSIPVMDDAVDALQDSGYKLVIESVRSKRLDVEPGIHIVNIVNKIESIADIACHIAKTVVYIVDDKRLRHL